MNIQWFGNSTFLIKTSIGKKLLIDPFNTLKTFSTSICPNIISVSKNSWTDLNNNLINSSTKFIYSNEYYSDEDIKIKGYLSYSDELLGLKRGENVIFTYEFDNHKLCHLGYLGEVLNDELIKTLKDIDILFIPIGGNLCLDGLNASKLSNLLCPKYIIPMCYKSFNSDFYFNGPKDFLSRCKNIYKHNSSILDISEIKSTSLPLTILLNDY